MAKLEFHDGAIGVGESGKGLVGLLANLEKVSNYGETLWSWRKRKLLVVLVVWFDCVGKKQCEGDGEENQRSYPGDCVHEMKLINVAVVLHPHTGSNICRWNWKKKYYSHFTPHIFRDGYK